MPVANLLISLEKRLCSYRQSLLHPAIETPTRPCPLTVMSTRKWLNPGVLQWMVGNGSVHKHSGLLLSYTDEV